MATYTWDANGNLLSDGTSTYTYDTANRLTSLTTGGTVDTYAYNGLGDRMQQTTDGVSTTYTLDLNAGLTQVLSDGKTNYLYGLVRIAQVNTTAEYYLGDALGSVRQLVDANGKITFSQVYQPYGEALSSEGDSASAYGFTGEMSDPSGLLYLRARYYDPGLGRFISRDMWEVDAYEPISYNLWLYVSANPINLLDPSGKQSHHCPFPNNPALWPSITGCPGSFSDQVRLLEERSEHPEKYDPTVEPPLIGWDPSVNVNLATQIAQNTKKAQYTVLVDKKEDQIPGKYGWNLCGQIALSMILETATGTTNQLLRIWEIGTNSTKDTTGVGDLINAAMRTFPGWQGAFYSYNTKLRADGVTGKQWWEWVGERNWYGDNSGSLVAIKLRMMLIQQHYIIVGVNINHSEWGELTTSSSGVGHWVALTAESRAWDYFKDESIWNWVRINNPFGNRVEYYPYHYFRKSMLQQSYHVVELWP